MFHRISSRLTTSSRRRLSASLVSTSLLSLAIILSNTLSPLAVFLTAQAQTSTTPGAVTNTKTMADYVKDLGFYTPDGTSGYDEVISQNRSGFDQLRDLAYKYGPMAGADPVLIVWWTLVETDQSFNPYTYNNCEDREGGTPKEVVCGSDNWQIAYGQQFSVAYSQLVNSFKAVYGSPDNPAQVQKVIQDVITKGGFTGTAPSNLTAGQIQAGSQQGDLRRWAFYLGKDPGISVYQLGTALTSFDRDEAFGYGSYYRDHWQQYSNGLNEVLKAWGTPGSPGNTPGGATSTFGPTEDPIDLVVPDCPGVTRTINAFNTPPSIYPKPNCGGGTPGAGALGNSTGKYGTGLGEPARDTLFWVIVGNLPDAKVSQGFGSTDFANDSEYGQSAYTYCDDMGVPGHCAVDIGIPAGTSLYSPVAGTVTIAGGTGYYCDTIAGGAGCGQGVGELAIETADKDIVILGHMRRIDVAVGATVTAGQYVGISGGENGPHLHLEYRKVDSTTKSGFRALDPREVFEVPAGSVTPHGGGTTSQAATSQVLAETTVASNFTQFQDKYGFLTPTGPSEIDFQKYKDNFAKIRDLSVKYAPTFNLEPEIVAWWTLFETHPPYDSYSYQNCLEMSPPLPIDQYCDGIGSGDWQIGYGQQYYQGVVGSDLTKVFQDTHGDPNDTALVQRVGQDVLDKSGVAKTFPAVTVSSLLANEPANRYWIFTLQRDPDISIYLLAAELRGDMDNWPGMKWTDVMAQWGDYYQRQDIKQNYSNILNDVLLNWGIVGSNITGDVCQVGVAKTIGNCSTEADVLAGLSVQEFVDLVNQDMDKFKNAAACGNVPWQMMASIYLRETAMGKNIDNEDGPWQIIGNPEGVNKNDFVEAGCYAAKLLAGKIDEQFAQTGLKQLTSDMDPTTKENEYAIKAAFFGYNGTGGWEINLDRTGCQQALDGNDKFNWDCSGYVMNNWDAEHKDMCINDLNFCDENDGVWKTFYKLYNSTYSADGKLLVYGGNCNIAGQVIDGLSLPTKNGKSINSTFWVPINSITPNHHGIDIANEPGDPIFAMAEGEVVSSGWYEYGYHVIIKVTKNIPAPRWVYYGHTAAENLPAVGTTVQAGQQIGTTGEMYVNTPDNPTGPKVKNGVLDGPHLHFDIWTTDRATPNIEEHVNPCSMQIFVNGYPELNCASETRGATWK